MPLKQDTEKKNVIRSALSCIEYFALRHLDATRDIALQTFAYSDG